MIKIVQNGTNINGHIQYKIVDKQGKVVHKVLSTSHMDWILSGCYAGEETDENYLHIQEDVFYDIDDEMFVASVKIYRSIVGEVTNYAEMRSKCKYALIDYDKIYNYLSLSFAAKLVFLFEVTAMLDSGEDVRCDNCPPYGEELELFLPPSRSVAVPVTDVDKFFKVKGCLIADPVNGSPYFQWVPK